jgi:hypothetical protein
MTLRATGARGSGIGGAMGFTSSSNVEISTSNFSVILVFGTSPSTWNLLGLGSITCILENILRIDGTLLGYSFLGAL